MKEFLLAMLPCQPVRELCVMGGGAGDSGQFFSLVGIKIPKMIAGWK